MNTSFNSHLERSCTQFFSVSISNMFSLLSAGESRDLFFRSLHYVPARISGTPVEMTGSLCVLELLTIYRNDRTKLLINFFLLFFVLTILSKSFRILINGNIIERYGTVGKGVKRPSHIIIFKLKFRTNISFFKVLKYFAEDIG